MRGLRIRRRLFWAGVVCVVLLLALGGMLVRPFSAMARWHTWPANARG